MTVWVVGGGMGADVSGRTRQDADDTGKLDRENVGEVSSKPRDLGSDRGYRLANAFIEPAFDFSYWWWLRSMSK
jgi:hypothetical protein